MSQVHDAGEGNGDAGQLPPGIVPAGGILDRIVVAKAARIAEAKISASAAVPATASQGASRFRSAIARSGGPNIIAEIKRRSPSKGLISSDFDPLRIAAAYSDGGAAALSILTEQDFFDGSLDHLRAVRTQLPLMPILRKDFIFDEFQIGESRRAGADAVLLIAAILSEDLLARLVVVCEREGLSALVEVHNAAEMQKAFAARASVIGVNNRDLRDFSVNLKTSKEMARLAPPGALLVAESGISTRAHLEELSSAGFNAFLIGEHLMLAPDAAAALRVLLGFELGN